MLEYRIIDLGIKLTCEKNNVLELYSKITYKFVHSLPDEFSRCYLESKRIEISRQVWDQASLKKKQNAIVHETAHIIARYKYGSSIPDHGSEWSRCVKLAGEEPHIFFKEEGEAYVVGCKCNKRSVTKDEHRELKSLAYVCRKCGELVVSFSG